MSPKLYAKVTHGIAPGTLILEAMVGIWPREWLGLESGD